VLEIPSFKKICRWRSNWNEIDYGNIVARLQRGRNALGLLVVGRLIDRFGTRIGYFRGLNYLEHLPRIVTTRLPASAFGFGSSSGRPWALASLEIFRPAIKTTTAEWVSQKRERALRHWYFQCRIECSGRSFAPLNSSLDLPLPGGGNGAFILTGAIGLSVARVFGIPLYAETRSAIHASRKQSLLIFSLTRPDQARCASSLAQTKFRIAQTSAFAIGKYMTDSDLWWFLSLLDFQTSCGQKSRTRPVNDRSAFDCHLLSSLMWWAVSAGGWLSSTLIKAADGRSMGRAPQDRDVSCCAPSR